MLRFLRIKRLAVIDAVEAEFGPGLNVLTGETGAGKSILVEAVGLMLGGRASGDLVRTGEDAAVIEAIFESGGKELLIKREVTAQGRSRAFINGELATAGALKDLANRLIELHGQHEHHVLLDPATHLKVLDGFGRLESQAARVAVACDTMRGVGEQLARIQRAVADRETRRDLLIFQLSELDRARLQPGEEEQLAATRQVLGSAARVERLCTESYAVLYESDGAVLAGLGGVWRRVTDLAALDPQFHPYLEARDAIKSQLEDLAAFLRSYAAGIDASPERLQDVEDRLALLERLKRKYGPTLEEAIGRRERIREELAELERGDDTIAELTHAHEAARTSFLAAAGQLSEARRSSAGEFARQLVESLGQLAMPDTQFEARFAADPLPEAEWTSEGIDRVEFFVSPNPGEDLRPLARIVSGGELSRIMLGIKTLMAAGRYGVSDADGRPPGHEAPGLIFDEVDAGIGGRAADVVGRKLRALGSAFQVLCITHLPQIAAYADTHFLIDKQIEGGRTITRVARLDEGGRVNELARMLGGEGITEGLLNSAREMLHGRQAPAPAPRTGREPGPKGESERAKAKGRRGA